jgi:phosphate transport system substrate-binding protein
MILEQLNLSRRRFVVGSALTLAVSARPAWAAGASSVLRLGGTGCALALGHILAEALAHERPGVSAEMVPSLGSSGGIKALAGGVIDVALSGRPLKDEEQAKGLVAHPFARSPLGFTSPADVTAEGVTLAEIADIYAGRTVFWPNGSPLRLVLRPEGDQDTTILRGMAPFMAAAVDSAFARAGLITAANDQENLDTLEKLPGSLGVAILGQIRAERRNLKMLRLDGVTPSTDALRSGAYRHQKTLYLVLRSEPSPLAAAFAAFVVSPAGRDRLAGVGGFLPPETASS